MKGEVIMDHIMWRTSSRSNEELNCVEVAAVPAWLKSSRTFENSNCVEVAAVSFPRSVAVRDSKDRSGPVLAFSASEWSAFVTVVQAGAY
jgi:Domain of unknown function (DUF397)